MLVDVTTEPNRSRERVVHEAAGSIPGTLTSKRHKISPNLECIALLTEFQHKVQIRGLGSQEPEHQSKQTPSPPYHIFFDSCDRHFPSPAFYLLSLLRSLD